MTPELDWRHWSADTPPVPTRHLETWRSESSSGMALVTLTGNEWVWTCRRRPLMPRGLAGGRAATAEDAKRQAEEVLNRWAGS